MIQTVKQRFAQRCLPGAVALAAGLAIGLPGCGGPDPDAPQGRPLERPVTRTAKSDPVELTFTVAPGDLPFTERATLLITAKAPAGTTVTIEDYDDLLRRGEHPFELSAQPVETIQAAPLPDRRFVWRHRYTLEFTLPGEYELPGPTIIYSEPASADKAAGSAASTGPAPESKTLSTDSITIIAEATEKAAMTPEELTKITVLPPVELHEGVSAWTWAAPLLVATAVVLAILLIRRQRRRRQQPSIVPSADEWARDALARLVAEDLLGRGLIREFHYRISDILRGYIERRYGVLAREMTTEEFLAAAGNDPRFDSGARGELDRFLGACDLVKYARHRALPTDGEALLKTTRAFVERTRERYDSVPGEQEDTIRGGRAA